MQIYKSYQLNMIINYLFICFIALKCCEFLNSEYKVNITCNDSIVVLEFSLFISLIFRLSELIGISRRINNK